ncbi:MAG: lipocalin family protein [Parvularculaceae bacterium]|nr:lipocalin family protein [Parvularculaceae bacterium]
MRIVIAMVGLVALLGCASQPVNRVSTVPLEVEGAVDLNKYLGRWFEIARFENRFERNCEGVTADYSMRKDGLIRVENTCREGSPAGEERKSVGRAKIVDPKTNAKLKVSFFGPFWGDYWILDLTDDYSRSIVGEPSGRYLWILSRSPTITPQSRDEAMKKLAGLGYDVSRLYFTRQAPTAEP